MSALEQMELFEKRLKVQAERSGGVRHMPDNIHDALSWRSPEPRAPSEPSRLHRQLVQLAALAAPTSLDIDENQAAVDRIKGHVQRALGHAARIDLFGSSVTGLRLPESDLDVACSVDLPEEDRSGLTTRQVREGDFALLHRVHLLAEDEAWPDLDFRAGAKVPVVCFVDGPSGLNVDLSALTADGPRSSRMMRAALAATPAARPLILALKMALGQLGMNKPFHGGVGSFVTFAMVTAALAHLLPPNAPPSHAVDLGVLLHDVLAQYCRDEERLVLDDPATGRELGGAAWAWPRIVTHIRNWRDGLMRSGCLSALITGWPIGGFLPDRAALRHLCAAAPDGERRAPNRGSIPRFRSRSPTRSSSRSRSSSGRARSRRFTRSRDRSSSHSSHRCRHGRTRSRSSSYGRRRRRRLRSSRSTSRRRRRNERDSRDRSRRRHDGDSDERRRSRSAARSDGERDSDDGHVDSRRGLGRQSRPQLPRREHNGQAARRSPEPPVRVRERQFYQ